MEFEYISDSNFQEILKRDYAELKRCQEVKASKSILVLCGSILEAILTDYFCENLPQNQTNQTILGLNLGSLLELAESALIINKSDKNLATVLKDYRNIIHPGREIRKSEVFDFASAELSILVLDLILKKIEYKYKEKYDLTAEDILFNLDSDWTYNSIYSRVITKLNSNQKRKLFDEFLEVETERKENYEYFHNSDEDKAEIVYPNIENVKDLVNQLKPLLSQEATISILNELKRRVTSAEAVEAFSLFNLIHEEIIQMSAENQELIAVYILTMYGQSCYYKEARDYYFDKTFSTIGKYFHTTNGFEVVSDVINQCSINFTMKPEISEFDTFEQFLNSLPEEKKEFEMKRLEGLFNRCYGDVSIHDFALEAHKRGLLNYQHRI